MAGSTNFLRWDETLKNILSDVEYASNSTRYNGAQSGIYPSVLHNKLAYQLSAFVAAFATAMANKGLVVEDGSEGTVGHDFDALVAVLSNVATPGDTSSRLFYSIEAADIINKVIWYPTSGDFILTGIDLVVASALEPGTGSYISLGTNKLYSGVTYQDQFISAEQGSEANLAVEKSVIQAYNNGSERALVAAMSKHLMNSYGSGHPLISEDSNDYVALFTDGTWLNGEIYVSITGYYLR